MINGFIANGVFALELVFSMRMLSALVRREELLRCLGPAVVSNNSWAPILCWCAFALAQAAYLLLDRFGGWMVIGLVTGLTFASLVPRIAPARGGAIGLAAGMLAWGGFSLLVPAGDFFARMVALTLFFGLMPLAVTWPASKEVTERWVLDAVLHSVAARLLKGPPLPGRTRISGRIRL